LITKVHDQIRKNPDRVKKAGNKNFKRDHTKFVQKRLTLAQKKKNVLIKLNIAKKNAAK